ncbi:MAG: hypothetical protein GY866_08670, partial [Proteobacteria bacterium]|nr:hypothetical protein [Pseudomonadota bacterium]
MLACSLVHEGVENLSLSRIQVSHNPLEKFPVDLGMAQCRQCVEPACVKACPEEALKPNAKYGNVRMVDKTSPIEWFTRGNFGGRFGAMLKFAGWDGIAIQGKADKPVWVDVRNDEVAIRDAKHLWGNDS